MTNPFDLSDAEFKTLQSIAEHGSHMVVADKMCLSRRTIEGRVRIARLKMNCANSWQAVVKLDRWVQEQKRLAA